MPSFSDLVWCIPLLYFLMFIIGLTVGKSKQPGTAGSSLVISSLAFIMSGGVLWERIAVQRVDYSFDLEWFVVGDTVYRVGYELNNVSAWLLMLIASLNILLLLLLHHKQGYHPHYGYVGLLLFAVSGLVLADHMLMFFIFAILISCSVYLLLAHPVYGSKPKAVFRLMTAQLLGFSVFFIALVGLYWYMPDHSLQFTMLETVFSGSAPSFTPFMKTIIAASLVISALMIAGILPYANWIKHIEVDRPILRVATFSFANALLPVYILLRFQMIISEVNDVVWFCRFAGAVIVIWCTVRMLLNSQQTLSYIGMMMLGAIVFAYGHGAYGYVLLQLTIILLAIVVIYGAAIYSSSIIVYGSFLVAILTLIGVPPLSGYWMQQSLVATIAKHGITWYIVSLVVVLCFALGTTIYLTIQWKTQLKQTGNRKISIIMFPALLLIALGLLWLVQHVSLEMWLFDTVTTESMQLLPMVLTMLSVIIGVAVAWLFSERITETLSSTLERTDLQLKQKAEQVGMSFVKLGSNIVKLEQWIERSIVQLLTVWLPYPLRMISRAGANHNMWYSVVLVIVFTAVITVLWYGLRRV